MRVWIDLTNSPHVLVMRPLIELLRANNVRDDDEDDIVILNLAVP